MLPQSTYGFALSAVINEDEDPQSYCLIDDAPTRKSTALYLSLTIQSMVQYAVLSRATQQLVPRSHSHTHLATLSRDEYTEHHVTESALLPLQSLPGDPTADP